MIGGQIIIQLRDDNNGKINIIGTEKNLKAGTFAKIKRALTMQKEIVFEDIIINGNTYTSGGGVLGARTYDGVEYVRVVAYYPTAASTGATSSFYVSSNDTVIVGA